MSAIQTAVRIKPIAKGEAATSNMQALPEAKRILLGAKAFDCDFVLPGTTTQISVFEHTCVPIVDSVIDGNQGTILVYGQTGTGKTHTMFSSTESSPDGIVYQSIQRMLEASIEKNAILALSALEVYLEKVTDLQSSKEVTVRKEFRPDLDWQPIKCITEAEKRINDALRSRHTTSTSMNERSSRGHVIINIKMLIPKVGEATQACDTPIDTNDAPIVESQLTLVDLAGSENTHRSRVQGRAMLEASSINRSLLALKKIILELSSSSAPSHVSYRDSKLTLLLQDSIGGYSKTLLIACVSTAGKDIEETRSTLEYATKARQIRNLVHSEKDRLLAKIKALEFDNQRYRNKFESFLHEKGSVTLSKAEYEELSSAKINSQLLEEELIDTRKRMNARLNSEIYLNVIRDISAEREKAHASEVQRLLDTHAKLNEGIRALTQAHFGKVMQVVAEAVQRMNETITPISNLSDEHNVMIRRESCAIQEKYKAHVTSTSASLVSKASECKWQARHAQRSFEAMCNNTGINEGLGVVTDSLKRAIGVLEDIAARSTPVENHTELSQIIHSIAESSVSTVQIAQNMETSFPDNTAFLSDIFSKFLETIKTETHAHFADRKVNLRPIEEELNEFAGKVRCLIASETEHQGEHCPVLPPKNSNRSSGGKDSYKRYSAGSQSSTEGGAVGRELRSSLSSQAKRRRP